MNDEAVVVAVTVVEDDEIAIGVTTADELTIDVVIFGVIRLLLLVNWFDC